MFGSPVPMMPSSVMPDADGFLLEASKISETVKERKLNQLFNNVGQPDPQNLVQQEDERLKEEAVCLNSLMVSFG